MRNPNCVSSQPSYIDPVAWAVIGFVVGTLVVAPLVLSRALRDKLQGGAIFGGSLGTLIGLVHGFKRRRKLPAQRGTSESIHAQTCPMCGSPTKANASRCLACGEGLVEPRDSLPAAAKQIPSVIGFAIILGMLAGTLLILKLRH